MNQPTEALAALILDVDGTMADTERDGHRVAYNRAFADLGTDWRWDETLYGDLLEVEGGTERLHHYLREYEPDFEPDEGHAAFVGAAHQRKNRHYEALLDAGRMPLRPGIRRLIAEAGDAGLRLAIASSSLRSNVRALLAASIDPGAEDWFETIVTGDDAATKKPDPEIYHRVLERLNLPASACIAIEDSANGCAAAHAAGVATIVTVSSYTREHAFPGALLVVDTLGEPDRPWHVLAGNAEGRTCLDVDLLRRLHARAHPPCGE